MDAGAYRRISDLPKIAPLFPLDGVLLLPKGELPLNIFEPRYLNMFDDALAGERMIGMIQTRPGGDAAHPALASVGCIGRITSFTELPDGRYIITLTGVCRFDVAAEVTTRLPYRQAEVRYDRFDTDLRPPPDDDGFDQVRFLTDLKSHLDRRGVKIKWDVVQRTPINHLIGGVAMALSLTPLDLQALLEAPTLKDRRETLITLLEIEDARSSRDDEPPSIQ